MKCRVCGGTLQPIVTDLPFELADRAIVVVQDLPVLQCESCSEYVLADLTFARVEELLSGVDAA